jgi:hypothetical protein
MGDMIPTFSLCHATARLPNGWHAAYDCWKERCDDWSKVEYILGIDKADIETYMKTMSRFQESCVVGRKTEISIEGIPVAVNFDRQCAVDGWNAAGRMATGRFLITAADDMFPPEHWDTELLKAIPSLDGEYALEVKSGTSPADDEWMRCMLHSFITRPYYERIGNFFYPEYFGMYADVDFGDMARRDGVVVDARHLTFQHKHWIGTNIEFDEIYQRQNAQAKYDLGMSILGTRRINGFAGGNRAPAEQEAIIKSTEV